MKVLIALLTVLVIAGCSHNWIKQGGTQQELDRDRFECKRKVTELKAMREEPANVWDGDPEMRECMGGQGWH